jgi:hypothetical protein
VAVQILVWPFSFLSSAFVPVETMPAGIRWVAEWNPLTAVVTASATCRARRRRPPAGRRSTPAPWRCLVRRTRRLFFALSAQRWSRLSH